MLTHLMVLIDKSAPSFCYYQHEAKKTELMPPDILDGVIDFAAKNNLAINFVLGKEQLPDDYLKKINSVNHVKIAPQSAKDFYPDAIFILDKDNSLPQGQNPTQHLILRLFRTDLPKMAAIIDSYTGKYQKLNLYFPDVADYNDENIDEYGKQLQLLKSSLVNEYKQGHYSEINCISDRMLLNAMNNCNAGIIHCTVAPNGAFYVCPGMYYENEADSIGNLKDGLQIKQKKLLTLEGAPICSCCDVYHCKRCIYLNKKTTLEINTPSHQQCILAHLERNVAKEALEELKAAGLFPEQQPISDINYLDPFLVVTGKVKKGAFPENPEQLNDRQLLISIYKMQKEILFKLQQTGRS